MAFKINHLHLKTPDPQKTVDWYVKYVGAKIVSERALPNGRKSFRLNLARRGAERDGISGRTEVGAVLRSRTRRHRYRQLRRRGREDQG